MIEQRLGESDAEYEARKRRIKLLRYVGNDMFAHAGGGSGGVSSATNYCILQGNDGIITWYGATLTDPAFGTIDPNETVLGQTVYAIKWNAAGDFVIRLGDLGNEPAPDVNIAVLTIGGDTLSLYWNPDVGALRYEGTALDTATQLIADYVEGSEICGYLRVVPNLFISYNFDLLRGTAV